MRQSGLKREAGNRLAMRGDPIIVVQCLQRLQTDASLLHGSGGRRIDPFKLRWISHAPLRAIQEQRGKVALQYLRRIIGSDRKSVVEGKSVYVRVDSGGGRISKKTNNTRSMKLRYTYIRHEQAYT